MHVVATRSFPCLFWRIYGHSSFTVSAEAEAQFETVSGAGGLFPFTINCNCPDDADGDGGGGDGGSGGGPTSTPTPTPSPTPTLTPTPTRTPSVSDQNPPTSGTVELVGSQSSYAISYVGQTGNTWVYEISEVDGLDLSHWLLDINPCLAHVVSSTPGGATLGADGSTGASGIKWTVNSAFTSGTFSFTLDNSYPAGLVHAYAVAGTGSGAVSIRGPICDGTGPGGGGGGSGVASVCLPTLSFETDTAGAALVAGQIIDTEWAAIGVNVTTNSPSSHPAMIFNTANPTGGDSDLGDTQPSVWWTRDRHWWWQRYAWQKQHTLGQSIDCCRK